MFFKDHSFFKSSDARSFLFFFLLSSLVAILIKLSKEYTKSYSVPVSIIEMPIDKTIKAITPSQIDFNAQVSGFSLLMSSFKKEHLEISFNNLDSISKTKYTYDTSRLNTQLRASLSGGKNFSDFNSSSISIDVNVLATKKLKVLTDVVIDFKQGYNTYDSARVIPDSITVVGPLRILKELEGIHSQKVNINNITNNVSLNLQLDTLAMYKQLRFSESNFIYEQDIAKYTEGSYAIPVTIRGAKKGAIKIFPREVRVYFVASLEEYDKVLPTDFEVIANFSTINKNDEFVVLSISRKPDNVRNVRLENKQVKYIVIN